MAKCVKESLPERQRAAFAIFTQKRSGIMRVHRSYAVGCKSFRRILCVSMAALMAAGCVIPHHRGVVNEIVPPLVHKVTKYFPFALYRLAEGDRLEFLYLTEPRTTAHPYRLQVRDQIDVEFSFHPEMNRTVRVRPDGKISIPRKDDISVAGMTADDVKRMLKRSYADLLKDPEITVTVRDFNGKLDEIQKAITTAPFG
jgi:polysaccharide export outer membrane protein